MLKIRSKTYDNIAVNYQAVSSEEKL